MNEKQLLTEIMAKGFDHLSAIANSLKKIQDEAKNEQEAIERSATLSVAFRALNDVLHPGFADAQELFPEQDLTTFLEGLNAAHKDAVEKNIFPYCKCSICGKKNESTTRNTDQA